MKRFGLFPYIADVVLSTRMSVIAIMQSTKQITDPATARHIRVSSGLP
jgi:hypothetical protein